MHPIPTSAAKFLLGCCGVTSIHQRDGLGHVPTKMPTVRLRSKEDSQDSTMAQTQRKSVSPGCFWPFHVSLLFNAAFGSEQIMLSYLCSSYSFHKGDKADSPQYAYPRRLRTWPESLELFGAKMSPMCICGHGSTPAGSGNQKEFHNDPHTRSSTYLAVTLES